MLYNFLSHPLHALNSKVRMYNFIWFITSFCARSSRVWEKYSRCVWTTRIVEKNKNECYENSIFDKCVWLKSGLNAFGVPFGNIFMSPCCISHPTQLSSGVFFGGKPKGDNKVHITFRVDHFVNPFMAINLIALKWISSVSESSGKLRFRDKSCKNPLEKVFALQRSSKHFLFLSYSKHLRFHRRRAHSPLRQHITSLRFSLLLSGSQLIVPIQLRVQSSSKIFFCCWVRQLWKEPGKGNSSCSPLLGGLNEFSLKIPYRVS